MPIRYNSFTFSLEAKDIILLPSFKGSTLRGGFGNAFRKVVCAIKKTDCADCLFKEKCIYSYIFETPPPSNTRIMTKYSNAPHPFIFEPPDERKRAFKPGDNITFGLTLIGKAIDYLPYFVYTFDELGNIGIGKGRGKYLLKAVKSKTLSVKGGEKEDILYDSDTKTLKSFEKSFLPFECNFPATSGRGSRGGGELSLSFLTPTRLVYNSRLTLDLEFHILIRQLLRRISLLSYFHCDIDLSAWDFKGMISQAKEVNVKERNLKWYDWERYSFRQDTRMKMGGFIGEITFEGDVEPFMPLIEAGEILHVGKGTSFGLGKYEIAPPS